MSRSPLSRLISVARLTKGLSATQRKRKVASCLLQVEELEPRLTPSTYFVATNGNDANSGLDPSDAWATFHRAFQNNYGGAYGSNYVHQSDTLDIVAGTYNQAIDDSASANYGIPSGVAGAPTIIQNYGGQVIIEPSNGADPLLIGVDSPTQIARQYITVQGTARDQLVIDGSQDGTNETGVYITGGSSYITLQNVEVQNILGWSGIMSSSNYLTFNDVDDHDNGWQDTNNLPGHGFYLRGDYDTISNCNVYHNHGNGIGFSTTDVGYRHITTLYSYNTLFDNDIYDNGGNGIVFRYGSDNVAYNNLVWGNTNGIDVDLGAASDELYSNTVYDNTANGIIIGNVENSEVWDTVLRNNISYGNGANGTSDFLDNNNDSTHPNVVTNNNFTDTGIGYYIAGSDPSFASTDSTNPDYLQLSAGSAMIDAGYTLGSPYNVDYLGVPRPQGSAYDIGAFEYVFPPATEYMGETNVLSIDDSGNGDLLLAQNATLAQSGTLQSLSFYVTQAAGSLEMGVYDASGPGGGPGNLLAETNSITPVDGWNTASVTSPVALAAGTYWLAYLPSDNNLHFLKGETSGVSNAYYSYSYGPMPNTFSTTPNTDPYHWSFYATLTSGTTTLLPQSQLSIDPNTTSGVANAANVLDGNTNTYATITGMPQDLVIDLGGTYSVAELQQTSYSGWSALQDYEIYVSTSDTNWGTPVTTGSFVPGFNDVTFAPTTGSYLILQYINNNNGGNYCFTSEINVGVIGGGGDDPSVLVAPTALSTTPAASPPTESNTRPAETSGSAIAVDKGVAAGNGGPLDAIYEQNLNFIQNLESVEMNLLTVLSQEYGYALGLNHDPHYATLLAALIDLDGWKQAGAR